LVTAPRPADGGETVALIPARAGSTGLPGKNLLEVGGRSLLARAIEVAGQVPGIDRIIVSTDGDDIAGAARREGAEVRWRPPELASDSSVVADTIRHVFETLREEERPVDVGILLEPTSPLRCAQDVLGCLHAVQQGADSAATFTEASLHPHRAFVLTEAGAEPFIAGAVPWQPRQALEPEAYQLSGGAYVFKYSGFPATGPAVLFGAIHPVVVPRERSLDIDDEVDLRMVEAMIAASETRRVGEGSR
jgi:CMP-N,N'-diacetyllegionaminic acid synthase